jgi:hypothetical protein
MIRTASMAVRAHRCDVGRRAEAKEGTPQSKIANTLLGILILNVLPRGLESYAWDREIFVSCVTTFQYRWRALLNDGKVLGAVTELVCLGAKL